MPLLCMPKNKFLLTDFLQRATHLNTGPASFPIISIVKLAKKRVFLEFSTLDERYRRLSMETLELAPKMLLKLTLIFNLQSIN